MSTNPIPYTVAWAQAMERYSALGVSPSQLAAEGFNRRHGEALRKAGLIFKATSTRWFVVDQRAFEDAVLFILTNGALGRAASRQRKAKEVTA
jgi:hypothetical protein